MNIHILISTLLFHVTALSADTGSYSLLKVEDGDTLVIDLNGNPTRVQLSGIDAPEDTANPKLTRDAGRTGESTDLLLAMGRRATAHLQQLTAPGTAVIVAGNLNRKDKYGRVPVIVSLPGAEYSLNSAMVQQGFAITLDGYSSDNRAKPELQQLEKRAQKERIGLWRSHPELMQAWSGRPDIKQ